MKRRTFIITTTLAFAGLGCLHADEPLPKDEKNLSFRNEIRGALDRGITWLTQQQNADGSFGKDIAHPALSALPLVALQREPQGKFRRVPPPEVMQKGYNYLRGFVQPDGGIYAKDAGLANYNTSVCLLALAGAADPKDEKLVLAARAYVVGQQASGMAKPET